MTMLDLRSLAAKTPVTLSGDVPLTEEDRARAIATWKGRMVNEHISARVFASLIPQMMKAGVDAEWQHEVAAMIQDELRHGQQCAAVVHALGGQALAELPPLADVPEHEDAGPLEAFLRNVIHISCMSETVAVALIRSEQQEVAPPEMAETLRQILGDEVRHARFGWRVLRALAPRIDEPMRKRLGQYLVIAFHHLREHELAHLPTEPVPSSAANEVGVCDGRDARRLFFDTVTQVIIPGLEKCRLPAQKAWEASFHVGAA
jgi:hypothetical protein